MHKWRSLTSSWEKIGICLSRQLIRQTMSDLLNISKQWQLMQRLRLIWGDHIGRWAAVVNSILQQWEHLSRPEEPRQVLRTKKTLIIRLPWWEDITLTLVISQPTTRALLKRSSLTSASRMQELPCMLYLLFIIPCRANDKKEDLRKHHFELGGVSAPHMTTH